MIGHLGISMLQLSVNKTVMDYLDRTNEHFVKSPDLFRKCHAMPEDILLEQVTSNFNICTVIYFHNILLLLM